MRIDKLLSELGLCTRREAAKIAKSGGIVVDGIPMKDASKHVDPEKSRITLLGREVVYQKYTYVMLNKPTGYVSATDDKSLPYVTELLPDELRRRELFPVGRLDRDTVGLMILTNNGPLAHRLLAPKTHCEKVYYFESRFPLSEEDRVTLENGVDLGDFTTAPCKVKLRSDQSGEITLTEGKYHQIKRMLEAVHNKVTMLERIRFADIALDPALERGQWRYLSEEEQKSIEIQL